MRIIARPLWSSQRCALTWSSLPHTRPTTCSSTSPRWAPTAWLGQVGTSRTTNHEGNQGRGTDHHLGQVAHQDVTQRSKRLAPSYSKEAPTQSESRLPHIQSQRSHSPRHTHQSHSNRSPLRTASNHFSHRGPTHHQYGSRVVPYQIHISMRSPSADYVRSASPSQKSSVQNEGKILMSISELQKLIDQIVQKRSTQIDQLYFFNDGNLENLPF